VVVRQAEERARILAEPDAHTIARVEKANQRTASIDRWEEVEAQVARLAGVVAVAPTVAGSAFVHRGNVSASVALRGVDSERYDRVIPVGSRLVAGRFRMTGSETVIGAQLASDLGVGVGDKLRVETTRGRSDVLTVAGVFDLGNKDVNQRWVFIPLRGAQTLLDLPNRISTLEVVVRDVFGADRVAAQAAALTGLEADSWMKLNRQLLVALKSQSSSSVMIQFFVVLAVALGIASVLVVSVIQKSKEIGILRAMGTARAQVLRVFLIQGGFMGLTGALFGSLLAWGFLLLWRGVARNPDGTPLFVVVIEPSLFAIACAGATFVGILSAVVPARRAARLDPAVAIRG
jgi:lipoprotein-releasing system permease protein